jgi:hypothetical protein
MIRPVNITHEIVVECAICGGPLYASFTRDTLSVEMCPKCEKEIREEERKAKP